MALTFAQRRSKGAIADPAGLAGHAMLLLFLMLLTNRRNIMAYVSQELKKSKIEPMKAVLKKHGLKGSLSVNNHSTLVLTIKSGKIDFIANFNETTNHGYGPAADYLQVNPYWYQNHFCGVAKDAMKDIMDVMFDGHWEELIS